jgi:homogentisate 1,2-dioxygenase
MSAHGPDKKAFDSGSSQVLVPVKLPDTMAFMFESTYIFKVTEFATGNHLDEEYYKCWEDLSNNFKSE